MQGLTGLGGKGKSETSRGKRNVGRGLGVWYVVSRRFTRTGSKKALTIRTPLAAVLLAAAFAACNAVPDSDRADSRDLTLPWTSDVSSVFNDRAQDNEFQEPPVSPVENATRQLEPDVPSPTPPEQPEPEPDVPSVSEPTAEGPEPSSAPLAGPALSAGVPFSLNISEGINTRNNRLGESVQATLDRPVFNSAGDLAIPAGAVFAGVISELEAPDDGAGSMAFTFTSVEFNGQSYPIDAVSVSVPATKKRRGSTAGDAAKVAVGSAIGGILGGLFGGNSKGTGVGVGVGAAAGLAAVALSRGWDLSLIAGSPIACTTTDRFGPLIFQL